MLSESHLNKQEWTPGSWHNFEAFQQPEYDDPKLHSDILSRIKGCPPLVSPGEVERLKKSIADAGEGKSFILQGGNCAERFIDCNAESIANQIKIILQMSLILTYSARKPVIRIGRIAGQYAKPRSRKTEVVDGQEIPSYFGDCVNEFKATPQTRRPNPERLLLSYYYSATTLNHIRAMIDGGFADMHRAYNWNLHSIEKAPKWREYQELVDRILDAINFMETFGGTDKESLGRIDFFTSHEGLILDYEEALTRKEPSSGRHHNLGAHMLWIGDRSRSTKGAHVEYFRGIANPIGIKLGPLATPEDVLELLSILNPEDEPGRIMLVTRLGADKVSNVLPRIIRAVQHSGRTVTWCCDPMHGNTSYKVGSFKTRRFSDILDELEQTFKIHQECNSNLAGVHFELTGEDVSECTGGAVELTNEDLPRNYSSYCDPRLNYSQSLEMAFLISKLIG